MKSHPFAKKITQYAENAPPFVHRMLEKKHLVQAYLRGELSKEELEKRGIKLATPV